MDTTTTEAKAYKYLITTAAKMAKRGAYMPCDLTVEVLYESLPADGSVEVRWEGFGRISGVEHFKTSRMRRAANGKGVEVLRQVAGGRIGELEPLLIHPLGKGRMVRTFRHAPIGKA